MRKEKLQKSLEGFLVRHPNFPCFEGEDEKTVDPVFIAKRRISFILEGGNTILIDKLNENMSVNYCDDDFLIISINNITHYIFWDKIVGFTLE